MRRQAPHPSEFLAVRVPVFCVDIDRRFGEERQRLVGVALFVERALQQVGLLVHAELARVGPHAAVACHLVVLDVLGCGNEACVEDVLIGAVGDETLGFLDQPFHALALLALGRNVELLADALQALYVPPGLTLVLQESLLELGMGGHLGHAR
jgi:hypothetical protein